MKKLLSDYGISQNTMVVYCDNSNAIDISKNPIQHSTTKHIKIRYHFIRDLVERKIVALEYISTECQNADIFTKPLDRSKFETLRQVIGVIMCPSHSCLFWSLCFISILFVTILLLFYLFIYLFLGFALHNIHAFHDRLFFVIPFKKI